MSWLHRTLDIYEPRLSPAGMQDRYGGGPYVDAEGLAISTTDWIWNPDLTAVSAFPDDVKYWIRQAFPDDTVTLMDQAARDAVDAAELSADIAAVRAAAVAAPDVAAEETSQGVEGLQLRELVELFNKRDNYIINRVTEVQEDLQAIKATNGPADNIRAAIRASYLATNTRTRAAAITDYKDDINAGNADT